MAFVVSLPLVFYLNLYVRKKSRFAFLVRFFLDVLWGIPSIVYGAFGFTLMVFFGLKASLLAGMITVALLIIPIMARSMDEVLKMIPFELKETSFALGSTRLETAVKVIFRQALPGIITAILIAFGKGVGDAAAVLFTASFTDSLPYSLFKPVATLPLAIFFQLGTPFPEVQERGYASALVLTGIIFLISIISRTLSNKFSKRIVKLVTHNLRQAERLADYVIFLYLGNLIEHGPAEEVLKHPKYLKTKNYINGEFIEELIIDKELNLKETIYPEIFVQAKLALEELKHGQILKIVIDHKLAVTEVPKALESEGHKILEVKRQNQTDWEIFVQKRNGIYTI